MVFIIYLQFLVQKQQIGVQAKFVFKMKLEVKKIYQVLELMIQVIIVKVNIFYQLLKVKALENTNQIHSQ